MLGSYMIAKEYRGPESRWADDHFRGIMRSGMALPTLPQVAQICVNENLPQSDTEFISSTAMLNYDDNGHKLDVYVHVPIQCGATDKESKHLAFRYPFNNPENIRKMLEGNFKDKDGNSVIFVVDRKSEAKLWKKHSDYFSGDGKWRSFDDIRLKSVEDAVKFPSVVAIFGGEENFTRYAEHYGIENIKLFYPALLSTSDRVMESHLVCLRGGDPQPYGYMHSAFNSIAMERAEEPEFDFNDFVIGKPGSLIF